MKKILVLLAALITLISCGQKKEKEEVAEPTPTKSLVLYYSQTQATQQVAQLIAEAVDGEIEMIEVTKPYDGTYDETIKRCMQERESGELPEVKPLNVNLDDYDVIYLGYPVWFGTMCLPMTSFVKNNDLSGKKIIPFCTFGSGGLNTSVADLKAAQPKAEILEGYGVRNARVAEAPAELDYFLKLNGHISGEVEKLPDYTEQQPVSPKETDLFNNAIADYAMLNGTTAQTFGSRPTSTGTDYLFTAESNGQQVQIKVTIAKGDGAKPEFTEVIR